MQVNQSQLIKLWPLRSHQTTRINLQKTKKSGKIETKWWYSKNLETYLHVLLSNCLVPDCCTFSRLRNLLPQTFFRPPIFSPSLYVFQVPLFYASFQTILSCTSSSFPFPLIFVSASQTKYAKENPLSFLLFPFLFQKSECSSLLMHDLLFPYVYSHINSLFPQKYLSYLLWVHMP